MACPAHLCPLLWIVVVCVAAFLPVDATRAPFISSLPDVLFPNGTGVTRASFPEGFLFGAITSAMKHEGSEFEDFKSENIWDSYARMSGHSLDGSLPGQCGNNYDVYKVDHGLLTELGMNSYRFSIAWSRIYPNGSGAVNEMAISHYNKVINDVLDRGLIPMVSLWSQDHPQILEEKYGGALDAQFITDYVNYAETCFKQFGDRIKFWITFDEPNDWAAMAYATDLNPPGRCTPDITTIGPGTVSYGSCPEGDSGTEPYIVGHNILLAHAETVDLYRNKYQPSQNGSIGMAIWFRWLEPLTNSSADLAASNRANEFVVAWFLDPIFFGDYPESMHEIVGARLPNFTTEQREKIQGSLDFIGLNIQSAYYAYDSDYYLTQTKTCYFLDWRANVTGERDGVAIGEGDSEYAVPWCMRKGIDYVKDRYSNFPTYITQTGWGIEFDNNGDTLDDDSRVEFFMTYYDELSQAIRDGANVKGVYAWSLFDGFEFFLGLQIRVGLFYVDDEFVRRPRKSAMWFKEMLATNASSTLTISSPLLQKQKRPSKIVLKI